MKKLVCAAFAAAFAVTSVAPAFAQPGRDHYDRGGDRYRGGDRHDHGYVHHNDWRRGHRMRHEDWDRGARIDWREHHLRRPPRGYEWREVDGNYVLAAAATGLIASIIANAH
jgi:Ni/Co efflux regulator RcnB